jgi:nitrogen regulatory protein P-II 2
MTLPKHPRRLLVIITEAALEKSLARDARRLGAHGYTVSDVRGAGHSGIREGSWEADRSIEMKIVCDTDIADRIAEHVLEQYGTNFGLTLFFADVEVLRPGKF